MAQPPNPDQMREQIARLELQVQQMELERKAALERAEQEKKTALELAEQQKQAALERAEQEKKTALELAEQQTQAALERAERAELEKNAAMEREANIQSALAILNGPSSSRCTCTGKSIIWF
jgi:hypothetical protein